MNITKFWLSQVTQLQMACGSKSSAAVRNCIKLIICDEALQHFTWAGTVDKKSFNTLNNIIACIKEAIRISVPTFNFREFNDKVKMWIRHTLERQKKSIGEMIV